MKTTVSMNCRGSSGGGVQLLLISVNVNALIHPIIYKWNFITVKSELTLSNKVEEIDIYWLQLQRRIAEICNVWISRRLLFVFLWWRRNLCPCMVPQRDKKSVTFLITSLLYYFSTFLSLHPLMITGHISTFQIFEFGVKSSSKCI